MEFTGNPAFNISYQYNAIFLQLMAMLLVHYGI